LIIIGIDPGLQCTGYGLISRGEHRTQFIAAGEIRSEAKAALAVRLNSLWTGVNEVLEQYRPEVFVIEQTFYNTNARTSLILGHARGVLMLAAAARGIPVVEYAAKVVKRSLTGNGNAGKEQVKYMVERVLNYQGLPEGKFDMSDALAVALTHHNHIRFEQMTGRV